MFGLKEDGRMRRVLRTTGAALGVAGFLSACSPAGEAAEADRADGPPAESVAQAESQPPQDVLDLSQLGVDEGSRMTAVIAVVDFSDFGCVHCATFHVSDYPALYDEFVAGGDVLWKYVPITLGGFPNGDLAAVSGLCVMDLGPARSFGGIRDRLFEEREAWLSASPADARELFIGYAAEFGIERDAFETCIDSDNARDRIENNNEMARRVGVSATPYFLVQGSPVRGAPPLADFQRVLRQLVTDARGAQADAPDA